MATNEDERSREVYYMAIALLAERRSKDPDRQVGACIFDEREGHDENENQGRVVGIGYNGMPLICRDGLMPWKKTAKQKLKSLYVVHAEANAIVNMNPQSVADCAIYVTLHPCCECAKQLIQSCVSKVVYLSFDTCYGNKDSFKESRTLLEKRMNENGKFEYRPFPSHELDKQLLEIQFGNPREDGSHSIWWKNEEGDSVNEPPSKKSRPGSGRAKYKCGNKYIGKEIELLQEEIDLLKKEIELFEGGRKPVYKNHRTLDECKRILQEMGKCMEELEESRQGIAEELKPISWEQYFMGMAIIAGDLTGSEAHEGACVVNEDSRIIGLGYCRIIDQIEVEKKGKKLKKKLDLHAPVIAMVNRNPVSLRDCTLYVTRFPCNECAKVIVQAGIKTVVYLDGQNAEEKNQGCAKQQVKVKGKNVSQDPTKKIFEIARVTCVSYKECYEPRRVILDFSKSDL